MKNWELMEKLSAFPAGAEIKQVIDTVDSSFNEITVIGKIDEVYVDEENKIVLYYAEPEI